jgi:hypothetical protein
MTKLALVESRNGKLVLLWDHLLTGFVVIAVGTILVETAWRWILSTFSEMAPESIGHKLVMGFTISAFTVPWLVWHAWAAERERQDTPPPTGPTRPVKR